MPTWELIQSVTNGAYIGGETFVNQSGEELYFDGTYLIGIDKIDLTKQHEWNYVGVKSA